MNGWLTFDSFGALLTPGRRDLCQAGRDKSSTILSTKRPTVAASIRRYFIFVIRKALNQHSLLFRASTQIGWRLHCNDGCKRSWSSTAIAVTDRLFT
jgi:hypothetical protein